MGSAPDPLFALVLHSHIPYVLSHGRWPHGTDWLVEAAAECYVQLLDVLARLVEDGISPRLTIGLTPVLLEQLADPSFADELEGYIEERCSAARADRTLFRRTNRPDMAALAGHWEAHYRDVGRRFVEVHGRDLVSAFAALQDAGHIEILTSAATHAYLPLASSDVCVRAQIRLGAETHRKHFGRPATGFWLPECAYRPGYAWQPPVERHRTPDPVERAGIEALLAEQGIRHFYVDAHLLEGGEATGAYVERFGALRELWAQYQTAHPSTSTCLPTTRPYVVRTNGPDAAPVAVFARDRDTGIQVWSGEVGYPGDEWYLEFHRKHFPGHLRYWRVSWPRDDLGAKELYDPLRAVARLPHHAAHFTQVVQGVLARAKPPAVVTAMYDTELFGHWWWEGAEWLYYAVRHLHEAGVRLVTSSEALDQSPPAQSVSLPEGSWGEGGYHWVWLNEWNAWASDLLYECEGDMVALVQETYQHPDARPLLAQAARELVLLESSDWAFNITTWSARDYAEARIRYHADAYRAVAALARQVASGLPGDAALWDAYREACERDRCFADIDPAWWLPGTDPGGG